MTQVSPLRAARKAANLTLDEACKKLGQGWHNADLSRYERGIHVPRLERARALAKFYGLSLESVLAGHSVS